MNSRDVAGERRDPRAPCSAQAGSSREHEAVILDRRAAARGVDDDGVEPGAVDLARPGVDVGARAGRAPRSLPDVMGERAAAAGARGDHHLDAVAGQQPDRRLVDLRRAAPAGRSRSAAPRAARRAPSRRKDLRPVDRRRRRQRRAARASSIAREPRRQQRRAKRPRRARAAEQRQAEQARPGQDRRRAAAQQPVEPAAGDRSPRCGAGA